MQIYATWADQAVPARLDRESILEACEASLKRLQTSYIDLYQLHWPDRYATTFGALAYDPTRERKAVPFEETVGAIKTLIDAGKIKFWGLSNETTFGVCELVKAADAVGCPRPVSIQNQFSLLTDPSRESWPRRVPPAITTSPSPSNW